MSAIVTVQVGQCGNQLGSTLFDSLFEHAEMYPNLSIETGCNPFLRPSSSSLSSSTTASSSSSSNGKGKSKARARAILVDTEPKVLNGCQHRSISSAQLASWSYDPRNIVHTGQGGGAGNNWAMGYATHGPHCSKQLMNTVRKEIERCDALGGLMILQSVAGGTGSGLGTYLTECLQDEYPQSDRMNMVVCPYHSGEVIVQNYNAVLTLSHLSTASDAIFFLENEHANKICTKLLHQPRPSLVDLNRVLSSHIASFLLPAEGEASQGGRARARYLRHSMSTLCSHPGYNLLTCRLTPQTPARSLAFENESWSGMIRRLYQMHLSGAYADCDIDWSIKPPLHRSLANLLVLRGRGATAIGGTTTSSDSNSNSHSSSHHHHSQHRRPSASQQQSSFSSTSTSMKDVDMFQDPSLYADWTLQGHDTYFSPHLFEQHDKAATLVSNSQAIIGPLERITSRAFEMSQSRAYLHQYEAHGVETQDFSQSFLAMDQVIESYKGLEVCK